MNLPNQDGQRKRYRLYSATFFTVNMTFHTQQRIFSTKKSLLQLKPCWETGFIWAINYFIYFLGRWYVYLWYIRSRGGLVIGKTGRIPDELVLQKAILSCIRDSKAKLGRSNTVKRHTVGRFFDFPPLIRS